MYVRHVSTQHKQGPLVLKRFAFDGADFKAYSNSFNCQRVIQVQVLTQDVMIFGRNAVEALYLVYDMVVLCTLDRRQHEVRRSCNLKSCQKVVHATQP